MLQKIFKLYNGEAIEIFSPADFTSLEHNEAYYRSLYDLPPNTHTYSYVEINCDNFEYIEATLQTLLELKLIDLSEFLPWFSNLEITPDYFSLDKPEFLTHRYAHSLEDKNFVFDFYLMSYHYELLSEKNYKAANRLKEAMLVLSPKYLIHNQLGYFSPVKAIEVFKI